MHVDDTEKVLRSIESTAALSPALSMTVNETILRATAAQIRISGLTLRQKWNCASSAISSLLPKN